MKWIVILALGMCIGVSNSPFLYACDGFVLSLGAVDQPFERVLGDVERAQRIGATHFNIPLLFCQQDKHANHVSWCQSGSAEAYKERAVTIAQALRARGLTVGYFPMILSEDGEWRGFFEPADFKAWGRSYLDRLLEMAEMAVRSDAQDFIVSTELNKIYVRSNAAEQRERNEYFRNVTAALRQKLGPRIRVIIVANWDQYDQIPFWDASDHIGLSAYYPLASGADDDTTIEALTERWRIWQRRLLRTAERHGKSLYFSEVGYASARVAAREPWSWLGELDLDLQRRLYAAFDAVWARDTRMSGRLARIQLWALDIAENPAFDTGFAVFGKPAEEVLRASFQTRSVDCIDHR